MNRDMENLLGICLDQLEQGTTIDVILGSYPEKSVELRPYLETAAQISQLASLPTVAAQQKSRQQFLERAAVLRSPQSDAFPPLWLTLRRLLLPTASLLAVILLFGYALLSTSNNAIPGDGLYPVKRTIENIRLINAANPEEVINLSVQFQEERLREIEALLRSGRTADVIFEGDIEALNFTNWVISGLSVMIENNTIIEGSERVGEMVRVEGHTSGGSLFADHIWVLTNQPDLEATPLPAIVPTSDLPETPTVTPVEPTETISPTSSATPSPTPTASGELQESPILAPIDTATPLPTATTEIVPTAAPPADNEDGDSGNENEGDNSNEDSGDDDNDNEGDNSDEDSGDDDNDNEGDNSDEDSRDDDNDNEGDNSDEDSGDDDNDNEGDNESEDSGGEDNDNGEVDEEGDNSIKRVNTRLSYSTSR